MRHIIVGYGEVGKAIHAIFKDAEIIDTGLNQFLNRPTYPGEVDVMHICFPYSQSEPDTKSLRDVTPGAVFKMPNKGFVHEVESYQNTFRPGLTIIHSSVPIGTCDKLNAVHSPVRGVHPYLEKGLRTFVKYFGGFKALEAARIFEEQGINVKVVGDARTTEALKLWDTTQYGVMIALEKEIHKFCRENNVDFEIVYRDANVSYNEGYTRLGMSHVVRPQLMHKEGKIGGHCVIENAHLLDTPTAKRIIEENSTL